MKIKEFMTKDIILINEDTTVWETAKLMDENEIGSIFITDENKAPLGIITDRDIVLRCVATNKDMKTTKVSEIMTREITGITPDTKVCEASKMMAKNQVRRLPVVENNQIIGVVSLGDLARKEEIPTPEVGDTLECICKDCE